MLKRFIIFFVLFSFTLVLITILEIGGDRFQLLENKWLNLLLYSASISIVVSIVDYLRLKFKK
jgi:hypothetical protein